VSVTFGSVCSGIEAASVAWKPLGWRASFVSEIEAFPRAVLAHHHPETPLHGDFTTISAGQYEPIDILVGGTPCQSFSVAGLRGGLADDRGNLALEYLRLADRLRPRWLVWENVPGVLSSNGGRDFGAILGGMVELGYGFAYRVLDAQFFGVAQRRRRVFVVGYLGDWRPPAAVLFERESLSGHPAPRRETGKAAPTIPSRSSAGGGLGTDFDLDGGVISFDTQQITSKANRSRVAPGLPASTLAKSGAQHVAFAIQGRAVSENPDAGPGGAGFRDDDAAYTLEARSVPQAIAYGLRSDLHRSGEAATPSADAKGKVRLRDAGFNPLEEMAPTLDAGAPHAVAFALRGRKGGAMPEAGGDLSNALRTPGGGASVPMVATSAVRRLTPRECERLQGFPDDYTLIPWRRGMAADGPRYKALGNSMAVPVMAWIGRRIEIVESIITRSKAAA
jgi:DNA (cytosine-5)-methyltransferase 1